MSQVFLLPLFFFFPRHAASWRFLRMVGSHVLYPLPPFFRLRRESHPKERQVFPLLCWCSGLFSLRNIFFFIILFLIWTGSRHPHSFFFCQALARKRLALFRRDLAAALSCARGIFFLLPANFFLYSKLELGFASFFFHLGLASFGCHFLTQASSALFRGSCVLLFLLE